MARASFADADTVTFDMDGTLVDSTDIAVEGTVAGLTRFFHERGETPILPSPGFIRSIVGMPSLEYFAALVPPEYRSRAEEIRACISPEEIRLIEEGRAKLFPGADDLLRALRAGGRRLVLVSNCGRRYFAPMQRALGLAGLFDRSYCLDDEPDKTRGVERALRELGTRRGVMVGDKGYDRDAARANRLAFIGVLYGYGRREELDGADALAGSIEELRGLLM